MQRERREKLAEKILQASPHLVNDIADLLEHVDQLEREVAERREGERECSGNVVGFPFYDPDQV